MTICLEIQLKHFWVFKQNNKMCTYVSQNCIVVHNLQNPPHVGGEREYILAVIAVVTASVPASWQQETQFLPLQQ